MSGDELRLQPGVTPEHHARLVEALAGAKAYPGGPERSAQTIAAAPAAAPPLPGRAAARAETPGGEPEVTGPHAYVTEVSVPVLGDGGVQRLHSRMLHPEPEPQAQ